MSYYNFSEENDLPKEDEHYMRLALQEAQIAFDHEEIPIGAIVVCKGRIIGRGHNLTEQLNDVTAHAEMQAFTAASLTLGGKYLKDCTLYVTLEPCLMCAGALYWSKIGRIVFGAFDEKNGYSSKTEWPFHPKTELTKGVLSTECAALMKEFFKARR